MEEPEDNWANRDFVLAAVRKEGSRSKDALRYATKELMADREVVLTAVKRHGYALKHASEELKANREVVLDAVS